MHVRPLACWLGIVCSISSIYFLLLGGLWLCNGQGGALH